MDQITPDEALERLQDGNRRFVADHSPNGDTSRERRLEVARSQEPFAALVGCSDSRVGPELLFGVGLGDLFIVRSAAGNLDSHGLGSIEFAVMQLNVPLVVVLGHERCGAIEVAVDAIASDLEFPGSMGTVIESIIPAVLHAQRGLAPDGDLVDAAVHENVRRIVRRMRTAAEPILLEPQRTGRLTIVGAYYALDTGVVDFFDVP